MNRWDNIGDRLFGVSLTIGVENKFLTAGAFFSVLTAAIGTVANLIIGLGLSMVLGTAAGVICYAVLYYLLRFKRWYTLGKWLMTFFSFFYIDLLWFQNYGSSGPILYILMVLYSMLLFIFERKQQLIITLIYIVNIVALFYLEYTHRGLLGGYPDASSRIIDNYSSFAIYVILISWLIISIKASYKFERERAVQSDRLKSAFLANMSHEIRTPMNAIIGFSQLAESNADEKKRQEYMQVVQDNAMYLLQLIDDIIDISKIESGQLDLHVSTFQLGDLFREVEVVIRQQLLKFEKQNLELEFVIPSAEIRITTDRLRVKQILINLLNNALKHTSDGSLVYGARLLPGSFEFFVSDTGSGIEPEHQPRVFERFYKVETIDSKVIQRGTGIGLAIVKNLVELLGGSIWFNSVPGKGTDFFFTIPQKIEVMISSAMQDRASSALKGSWDGKCILIAEDDSHSYLFLKEVLSRTGVRILYAANGEEAVRHCQRNNGIDLVLMDVKMPVLNGLEATRLIKSMRPDLPVIAQTAYASEADRDKVREAGCDDFISKPILVGKLLMTLDTYMNR